MAPSIGRSGAGLDRRRRGQPYRGRRITLTRNGAGAHRHSRKIEVSPPPSGMRRHLDTKSTACRARTAYPLERSGERPYELDLRDKTLWRRVSGVSIGVTSPLRKLRLHWDCLLPSARAKMVTCDPELYGPSPKN